MPEMKVRVSAKSDKKVAKAVANLRQAKAKGPRDFYVSSADDGLSGPFTEEELREYIDERELTPHQFEPGFLANTFADYTIIRGAVIAPRFTVTFP